jgi:hypothetical protein
VWKEAKNVKDFTNRITGARYNISNIKVVRKMLQVVPDHLAQVAVSIKTLLDINSITIEEVTGMLCIV